MLPIREQAARLTRKKRTRTRPEAEPLDDRVVPAVMGVGHGGFAAAGQNPYALRIQEVRQQRMARHEARLEQIQAMRQQRMLMIQQRLQARTGRMHPNFGGSNATAFTSLNTTRTVTPNFRSPAMVGAATPTGPLALGSYSTGTTASNPTLHAHSGFATSGTSFSSNGTPVSISPDTTRGAGAGSTGSNGQSTAYNLTSPNDFPFGPGGFYTIATMPNGDMVGFK